MIKAAFRSTFGRMTGSMGKAPAMGLLAAMSLALAGCGGGQSASDPANASVLRRSTSDEPRSLDPHFVPGNAGAAIMNDMFEGLLAKAADGKVIPGLAESYTVSEDGTVYTFTLRENIRWSDGKPITSEDFVYSFRRAADPATAARAARALFPIRNARAVIRGSLPPDRIGVSAPDARTVVVELERPTAYITDILSSFPTSVVPRHVIEQHGQRWTAAGTMVTSGAYTLAEWISNTHIKLRKNAHYHDAANVGIDEVIYYPVERPATALTRFRAGELDVVFNVPVNQMDWIKETYPDELKSSRVIGLFYALINNERAPTNDPRVREALSISVDRDLIASTLLRNESEPAYSIVPASMPDYEINPLPYSREPIAQRQQRARELLAQAGYNERNPLRITYKFGGQEINRRVAVALQTMWQAIGVQAELDNVGANAAVADARDGNYTAMRYTYYAPFKDPVSFLRLLDSESNTNFSRYRNPEYDRALFEADGIVDPEARHQRLREVEAMAMRDHPVIPIYYPIRYYLVSSRVQGWVAHPGGEHLTRHLTLDGPAQARR